MQINKQQPKMTRKQIHKKLLENFQKIEALKREKIELEIQNMLLCDDVQQYYECEVEIKKRGKVIGKQIHGCIKWVESFKDEATGDNISIERTQVVRINGVWL